MWFFGAREEWIKSLGPKCIMGRKNESESSGVVDVTTTL